MLPVSCESVLAKSLIAHCAHDESRCDPRDARLSPRSASPSPASPAVPARFDGTTTGTTGSKTSAAPEHAFGNTEDGAAERRRRNLRRRDPGVPPKVGRPRRVGGRPEGRPTRVRPWIRARGREPRSSSPTGLLVQDRQHFETSDGCRDARSRRPRTTDPRRHSVRYPRRIPAGERTDGSTVSGSSAAWIADRRPRTSSTPRRWIG